MTNSVLSHFRMAQPTNNTNQCNCCHFCKGRITRLQIMMNELFSYISDYLPEEMQEVHQQPPPPPPPKIAFNQPSPRDFGEPIIRNPMKLIIGNQPAMINNHDSQRLPRKEIPAQSHQPREKLPRKRLPSHLLHGNTNRIKFPSQLRRKYTHKDKMHIVSSIQAAIQKGQKIVDACAKHNICDRSYQRWKKQLEEGYGQGSQCSNSDLIIQDAQI